ncbi:hypothetical protein FAIPA1_540003 [Frankia sp. AiPs1]
MRPGADPGLRQSRERRVDWRRGLVAATAARPATAAVYLISFRLVGREGRRGLLPGLLCLARGGSEVAVVGPAPGTGGGTGGPRGRCPPDHRRDPGRRQPYR